MAFPGLVPSTVGLDSAVLPAQRFLASAYDSVASLVGTAYPALRGQRPASRGRLTHAEQDLFRAAVVFAGAGVDTALKEALRSCIPLRVQQSVTARGKYLDFVTRYLEDGTGAISAKRMAVLLTAGQPESELLDAYVRFLTGSSLQSQEQVKNSLSALGLDKSLYIDVSNLDPLFKARNEIAHEMDMTPAAVKRKQGVRTRHERSLQTYKSTCHRGLTYCQRVLNALAAEC